MKLIYKSFFLLVVGTCFLFQPLFAQTSGGPDEYGYTWANSDDPNGPAFEWIDITATGTEVMGLGDDNSVPLVDLGFTFQYYWLEFDQIRIGSNGWLSFDNVSNVAHCFPSTPTVGRGNNLLAPLMSDLNFDGSTNPGQVFYLNDGAGKFIVSFINVPFWVNANPAFTGSNTFQVVLDVSDNSITFNYEDVESGTYDPTTTCDTDAVIGIENTTGTIGIQIAAQIIPEDNTSIRFEFPANSTFEITDIAAIFNSTPDNSGRFYLPTDEVPTTVGLINDGNVDITGSIGVLARINSNTGFSYIQGDEITDTTIPAGETIEVALPPLTAAGVDNTPGNYSFSTQIGLNGDLVSSNDINTSEFSVVDVSAAGIPLSYVRATVPTGQFSFTGGGGDSGVAVHMEPPFFPASISAVEMFVFGDAVNADDAFSVQIHDDDGVNGAPGTLIGLASVDGGSYDPAGELLRIELPFPIAINSGGFYIAWVQQGSTLTIGTETNAPFSRQTFELVGGDFAQFRNNETTDVMINAILDNPFFVAVNDLELDNGVRIFPNPTTGLINIDNQLAEDAISRVQVYNTLGQVILDQSINIVAGDLQSIDLSNQPHGIYYMNIQADQAQITRKISLSK